MCEDGLNRLLHLPVFEIHWSLAAEDADRDAQLAAFQIDFFDDTVLVLERAVGHFHLVANLKADLRFDRVFTLANLSKETKCPSVE